ncbi:Thiol-disulfide oxidoreductase ResA [compost metagenome]
MKNLLSSISLSILTILISTSVTSAQGFKIKGTVNDIPDGTWLYLELPTPDKQIDSSKVVNGKFSFSGKIAEKSANVILHTSKYQDYVFFWLENKNISISLKQGEFKKASVKGSITQLENEKLRQLQAPIDKKEDSLTNLLKATTQENIKNDLREQLKAVRAEAVQFDISYVKNNPNSMIAVNILDIYSSTWGREKTSELYQNLSPSIKSTSFGKNINNFISLNKNIKVGDRFADFEQMNTKGEMVKLSAIKGKYILLEFWGSWCGPCREENPNLVKTYNLFKDKGFNILGVAADDNKAQWLKAIKDDQLPWENVSDLKGDKNVAALIYGINAYPTNFLINEEGVIIAKNLRGDALSKKLVELLP